MLQNFRMIDVGQKLTTKRRAVAAGSIRLTPDLMQMVTKGDSPKGNILAMAEVAGIMATKKTSDILPLCHPLQIDAVKIWFQLGEVTVQAFCEVICHGKTGVEMEALFGVNASLLTIYDLAKAVEPRIELLNSRLILKEGGKSGLWMDPEFQESFVSTSEPVKKNYAHVRFAIGTLSDRASQGLYEDRSGPVLSQYCTERGGTQTFLKVIPDQKQNLMALIEEAKQADSDVLLLTGGTGISARDITPDVLKEIAQKELVGFGEVQRSFGSRFTESAWLSRASAYVIDDLLVVLFPGSPKAVEQGLSCIGDLIPHALRMIQGMSHH